jgi:hypothetical protein
VSMPDVRHLIAQCSRKDVLSAACGGVSYGSAWDLYGLHSRRLIAIAASIKTTANSKLSIPSFTPLTLSASPIKISATVTTARVAVSYFDIVISGLSPA